MRIPTYFLGCLCLIAATAAITYQHYRLDEIEGELAVLAPDPIDIGFAQSMLLHHQQAIAMSQILLDGNATGLASLARNIAGTQMVEMGEMQGWLKLWGENVHVPKPEMSWMLLGKNPLDETQQKYVLDCGNAPSGMLGLATLAELNQFRSLEGRARDQLFLEMMLAHHQGALPMAQFAAQESKLPAVRKLAAQITLDQSKEIFQMQTILASLAGTATQQAQR